MFSSLKDKISLLEGYVLEDTRHFTLVQRLGSQRFDLHWSFSTAGSRWLFESSLWNDDLYDDVSLSLSTEELLPILQEHGICMEEFTQQVDSYLLSYGAHMLDALRALEHLYGSQVLHSAAEGFAALGPELFDMLEDAAAKQPAASPPLPGADAADVGESNLWDGYDLSTLQIAAALREPLLKGVVS